MGTSGISKESTYEKRNLCISVVFIGESTFKLFSCYTSPTYLFTFIIGLLTNIDTRSSFVIGNDKPFIMSTFWPTNKVGQFEQLFSAYVVCKPSYNTQ